jgi:hypothetical protein
MLRSANEDEVRSLFSRFGRVVEVNLFRAFQVRARVRVCPAGARALVGVPRQH